MAAIEQNTLKRRGVGLRACERERVSPGFTLFAPHFVENRNVYLIDLQGEVAHTWTMPYPPGLSGYLTERGTLFYNGRTSEESFLGRFPFKGGVVLEADWNGNVLWEVHHPDHHHHGILLRNDNVLLHCMAEVPSDIARRVTGGMVESNMQSGQYAPGREAEAGKMYSDYLAEVNSCKADGLAMAYVGASRSRSGWHCRGAGAAHALGLRGTASDQLPEDDILASYRPTSTVIRISRKTGQIVWKLGPPTVAGQHGPTLLANGNVLRSHNGPHRLDDLVPYSRAIEVNPATNEIVWEYQDKPTWNFFSPRMGYAQRLPNGNTLITESSFGRFFEVTKGGEIVWEYVNPLFGKPFFGGTPGSESNQVFRAIRYSAEEITRARERS